MEELKKIERIPASMQVVESIKQAIQSGRFKVGDKLPTEPELSLEMGVSRSSLREGMRILAAYGVIEIRQGDGTYLVNKFAEHVFEFMGFIPTEENIKYITNLRRIIEIGCAGQIVNQFNEQECRELRALTEKMANGVSFDQRINADAEFHKKMIDKVQNPMLNSIYQMMSSMISVLMHTNMKSEEIAGNAVSTHLLLCESFENKDYEKLIAALNKHYASIL